MEQVRINDPSLPPVSPEMEAPPDVGWGGAPSDISVGNQGPYLPDMGMQNTPNMPPPMPDQMPAEAPPPSPLFQKKAKEYVAAFCKASKVYVEQKVSLWELLESLYLSKIGIRDWQAWRQGVRLSTTQSRIDPTTLFQYNGSAESTIWQSDYIHAPGYLVDNYTDTAWSSLFTGSEFLAVVSESPESSTLNGPDYPVAFKLQQLLLDRLERGQIQARIYECLQSCACLGTVFAKLYWHARIVPEFKWKLTYPEPERFEERDVISECPIVQIVPLDKMLPDPKALHNDIQRWRGIGHRVDRTYDEIALNFRSGIYNINESEFKNRWKAEQQGGGESSEEGGLYRDTDADVETDKTLWLEVWEWHGSIPFDGDFVECCCSFITEKGAESPDEGVMCRLTTRPLLDCGFRPFVTAHFTQRPGPFGVGIIEREEDILYQISQFIGQSQDNARITSNPLFQLDTSSPAWKTIQNNNGVLHPGMVLPRLAGDEAGLAPVKLPQFPDQTITNMVQFLGNVLERHTAVTDTQQGMSQRPKTATEASILQQQGAVPSKTKALLFAKSFVEPMAVMALAMIQQFSEGSQSVVIRGANGMDTPIQISKEEIQTGKYKVVTQLSKQDHTTIAKAQSIERALPNLAQLQQFLMQEGTQISFSELARRYVDLLGIEGADRIVRQMDPMQAQMMQMQQMQGGQQQPQPQIKGGSPGQGSPGPGGPQGSLPPPGGPPLLNQTNQKGQTEQEQKPSSPPLIQNGGPMGDQQTNQNAIAQLLQFIAQKNEGGMP